MIENKIILVTGAGGLLGAKVVESLIEYGASVIAADIDPDKMELVFSKFPVEYKAKIALVKLDVVEDSQVIEFFASLPRIDGAVNCTYPRNRAYGTNFLDVKLADFNENVSLHLGSSFLFMQQCAKYFQERGRPFSLVNISSVYGVIAPRFEIYDGLPMTMPVEYAAIKSALIHLNSYLVKYVSNSDFRSNCISPGGLLDQQSQEFQKRYKGHCMGKGMLDIEDITGTIIYLLSDLSRFVNGQNIIVDDGFVL